MGNMFLTITLKKIISLILQYPLNRYDSFICLGTFSPLMASFPMLLTFNNIFMEGKTDFLQEQILKKQFAVLGYQARKITPSQQHPVWNRGAVPTLTITVWSMP